MGRYDDLVFTIPQEFHSWYGFASPRGFFRGTTMMPAAKLYMDFTSVTKELVMEVPHTHHAVDEYLVFTGADLKNFWEFDAEVDVWIGEDPENLELYTLTEPTIIRVPPKLYHCPVNFRRISKPIVFSAVYLDGDWSKINRSVGPDGRESFTYDGAGIRRCVMDRSKECIYCGKCFSAAMKDMMAKAEKDQAEKGGEKPAGTDMLKSYYDMAKKARTGKYDKYVHRFQPHYHDDANFLSPRAEFNGVDTMPGSRLSYMYDIIMRECELSTVHMHHAVEEYLIFTGSDITNFFDFDAEIEIQIGAGPDAMDTYTITEPTVIRVPAGMWHGPVRFKRIGAPINFMPFYPNGSYGRVVRKETDGGVEYIYEGADLPK
jgi:hypothetical protein